MAPGRRRRLAALCLLVVLLTVTYYSTATSPALKPSPSGAPNDATLILPATRPTLNPDTAHAKHPTTTLAELLNSRFPHQHDILLHHAKRDRILQMCHSTHWRTLSQAVYYVEGRIFIKTGDIPEMWIRDSGAQVHLYMLLVKEHPFMQALISNYVNVTAWFILFDPYANSYRDSVKQRQILTPFEKSLGRYDYVGTWNYELDSGCYFFRMLYLFWTQAPNDPVWREERIVKSVKRMIELWEVEQYHHENRALPGYFNPSRNTSIYTYPEICCKGRGFPVGYTGMTWTGFRPSDDPCDFGYLVPANMFASATLKYIQKMAKELWKDDALAVRATKLQQEIDTGIRKYGIVNHSTYGPIYAFEVDGLGKYLLMDDANVPSLMSIPYLGWDYDAVIYNNTRRFILSKDNEFYQVSDNGKFRGIGSPHGGTYFANRHNVRRTEAEATQLRNNIWPMSQIMQGLTSNDPQEKLDILEQLLASDGGTGFMHESYDANNPSTYTRPFFCWADALFAEFVLSMITSDECAQAKPFLDNFDKKKLLPTFV